MFEVSGDTGKLPVLQIMLAQKPGYAAKAREVPAKRST